LKREREKEIERQGEKEGERERKEKLFYPSQYLEPKSKC